MRKIHKLSSHLADLIAAGEVVERPVNVVKELIENSIDAGALEILVEIENGGISYIRITDSGQGMSKNDAPIAFLRHATSKILVQEDLEHISTLGFRGEALAAISAVSKIDLFTKTKGDKEGTMLKVVAGEVTEISSAAAKDGTTIIVRDLFYNTPARMKFLKKDYTEASYITSIVENLALCNPQIKFKYIKDGKTILNTNGNSNLSETIYSVLGKDAYNSFVKVLALEKDGISINGFISKPELSKSSRSLQKFFVNGRYVKSKILLSALELSYKNQIMVGKFPGCVININLNESKVDVNVHPTKTEVRFANEKAVFDALYLAVKSTLDNMNIIPNIKNVKRSFSDNNDDVVYKTQQTFSVDNIDNFNQNTKNALDFIANSVDNSLSQDFVSSTTQQEITHKSAVFMFPDIDLSNEEFSYTKVEKNDETCEKLQETIQKPVKFIGECFNTYILCEYENNFILVDKHAAHERINFNKLKESTTGVDSQMLIVPKIIKLPSNEYGLFIENLDEINKIGFNIEDFSDGNVVVREIPLILQKEDTESIILEISAKLSSNNHIELPKIDDILHIIACKSAIKGNVFTNNEELLQLAKRVIFDEKINFCPHGRPVKINLSKYEIEKMFKRS